MKPHLDLVRRFVDEVENSDTFFDRDSKGNDVEYYELNAEIVKPAVEYMKKLLTFSDVLKGVKNANKDGV